MLFSSVRSEDTPSGFWILFSCVGGLVFSMSLSFLLVDLTGAASNSTMNWWTEKDSGSAAVTTSIRRDLCSRDRRYISSGQGI